VRTFEPVIDEREIRRVAIIRNSGAWAISHRDELRDLLEERGGSIVLDETGPQADSNDLRTAVTKAYAAHPDAVFLALGQNDASHTVRMLREQGFEGAILSSDGAINTALRQGLLLPDELQDTYFLSMAPVDSEFIQRYRAAYGVAPGVSADTAYDAVYALARAMRAANSTQTDEMLAQLDRDETFDVNGDSIRAVPLYYAEDGVIERIAEIAQAQQ
jgi:branched-chain amino acid transport system substrate-binding protein